MTEHVPPVLSEEALRREHWLRSADAIDAMLPGLASGQDLDFDAHEINRHFQFRFRQTRHADRVFLRRDNHGQVAPDAAIDEAADFAFSEVMVIDVTQ